LCFHKLNAINWNYILVNAVGNRCVYNKGTVN